MREAVADAFLLLALWYAESTGASDGIWSALLLATKESPPGPVSETLQKFAPTSRKVFGYSSLYLLGEKKRELVSGGEEWLVPSKEFFFKGAMSLLRRNIFLVAHRVVSQQESLAHNRSEAGERCAPLHAEPWLGEGYPARRQLSHACDLLSPRASMEI